MYILTLITVLNFGFGETQFEAYTHPVHQNGFLECVEFGEQGKKAFYSSYSYIENKAAFISCKKVLEN